MAEVTEPTYRAAVYSTDGVVAAPHYLASLAGAHVLRDGGSAVDAAIAANAVMCVTWPQMCGPGGDLFAQVWSASDNRLLALNASGRAGARMTLDAYHERGLQAVPQRGPLTVTVPGAVDGWLSLHGRWGRLPLDRLLRDAIRHAEEGFAVTNRLVAAIGRQTALLQVGGAAGTYLPHGRTPQPGERLVQGDLAGSLRAIATQGRAALYGGEIGRRIAEHLQERGGMLEEADIAAHTSEWVEPLGVPYRGVTVSQLPPNSQGIVLLQMLNMLGTADPAAWGSGSAELIHQLVERKKLAFEDRDRYIGDPAAVEMPLARLLDDDYAHERAGQIGRNARTAGVTADEKGGAGDTIYLCAADRDGNVVSLIQSLFSDWGSGILVPGTGVLLQNRGFGFRLAAGHPNALAPGRRPMHTLMPGFALREGRPWMAFGTRGADGQPQTGLQVLVSTLDFGLEPQAAVEAPRWVHGAPGDAFPKDALVLESRFGSAVADELRARGHQVIESAALEFTMGTLQVIRVDESRGCYVAASDPRGEGAALAM